MLTQNGLNPDSDVRIRGLGSDYPRQLELFSLGEIAALLSPEPNSTIGEARGLVRSWGNVLDPSDVPDMQWSIQVANEEFLRQEPDLVRRFLQVAQRASRYLGEHPDEWVAFNASLFGLSYDITAKSVTRERPTLHFDGQLDLAGLDRAIALQHHTRSIGSSA